MRHHTGKRPLAHCCAEGLVVAAIADDVLRRHRDLEPVVLERGHDVAAHALARGLARKLLRPATGVRSLVRDELVALRTATAVRRVEVEESLRRLPRRDEQCATTDAVRLLDPEER